MRISDWSSDVCSSDLATHAADEGAAAETPEPCNAGVVLIGYGRVGSHIGGMICGRGEGLTVIEDQKDMAADAEAEGATVIVGDATKESILRKAGHEQASTLLSAIHSGEQGGGHDRAATESHL